jgi:hypothetical protein
MTIELIPGCYYAGKAKENYHGRLLVAWRKLLGLHNGKARYMDMAGGLHVCTLEEFTEWTKGMMGSNSYAVKYGAGDLYAAADFIESLPKERFEMSHWWLPDGMAFDDDRNEHYKVADNPCGCAAGNMAVEGLFGLSLELFENPREYVFTRLADLFAIRTVEAEFIFNQYAYSCDVSAARVAERMRFVASQKRGTT